MAKNTTQIFPAGGAISWVGPLVAANPTRTGTSGTLYTVFTAGADGDWVIKLRFQPLGVNSAASVARIWLSNGSGTGTAANNTLIDEVDLPTSVATETGATPAVDRNLTFMLQAGYVIFCTLGTAGSAGWQVTCFAQSYTA